MQKKTHLSDSLSFEVEVLDILINKLNDISAASKRLQDFITNNKIGIREFHSFFLKKKLFKMGV